MMGKTPSWEGCLTLVYEWVLPEMRQGGGVHLQLLKEVRLRGVVPGPGGSLLQGDGQVLPAHRSEGPVAAHWYTHPVLYTHMVRAHAQVGQHSARTRGIKNRVGKKHVLCVFETRLNHPFKTKYFKHNIILMTNNRLKDSGGVICAADLKHSTY